jgi:ribosome biogenesis GTPase
LRSPKERWKKRSLEARILSVHSSYCDASCGARVVRCAFRGRLRRESEVHAGDVVDLLEKGGDLVIDRVRERKNLLVRPAVANVDQAVVVTAITQPLVDLLYVDRLLVHLEAQDVGAAICINKNDIEDPAKVAWLRTVYEKAGYPAVVTSAVTGEGLESLVRVMQGKNVVLAGASGVGKSKILSTLLSLDLLTATLSRRSRGRQTTKGVTLYRVGDSGFLADTPGFSRLDIVGCRPEELSYYYREMTQLIPLCHFPRCLHRTEDLCEVRKAVSEGRIGEERYRSYLSLLEECQLNEKRKYE